MTLSRRLTLARDALAVRPSERILEVGCGQGVLVGALADQLTDGHVVGVDRSEKMLAVARRAQAHHVDAGRASFASGRAQDLNPALEPFDGVVAARVREMHTDPTALSAVHAVMAPGARLLLVVDSPGGRVPAEQLATMVAAVTSHGFVDAVVEHLDAHVSCIRSRR